MVTLCCQTLSEKSWLGYLCDLGKENCIFGTIQEFPSVIISGDN